MSIGKKHTFWGIINDDEYGKILIPKIQRDYVQGRKTPQVDFARQKLLDEISEVIKSSEKNMDLNYVYGKKEADCFVPIDGQQRLTTLLILHIYAFSKEGFLDNLKVLQKNFIYETRVTTGRFLEEITQHLPSFFSETTKYEDIKSFVQDSSWFSDNWLNDPSVVSFLVVLDDIHIRFSDIKDISIKLISAECPITFMALPISNMGKANDLYIKMNSRGKPLSDFESFKSELFNYIDACGFNKYSDFKNKIDNEWMSMIWDNCYNPQENCDNAFMYLIHWIILNYVIPNKKSYDYDNIKKILDNKGFFNFDNYKSFLSDGIAINDLYVTLKFFEFLQENKLQVRCDLLEYLIKKPTTADLPDRVLLFSVTKFARTISVENWTVKAFNDWYRIIGNLVSNTPIDKEDRFIAACQSIDSFESDALTDSLSYFACGRKDKISFFDKQQISEEIYKAKLIKDDEDWENSIIEAESHGYFNSEILFALRLCGVDVDDFSTIDKIEINQFDSVWNTIKLIFADKELQVNDSLFRRAMLTYGDYSIWANSSYTFFFEGGKGYFNWRRMLREEKSFSVFRQLFEDVHGRVSNPLDVEKILVTRIDDFVDETNEFIYYTIKYPQLFSYMNEKRFYVCSGDKHKNRIILYSKARLSAEYAEMYTYIVKIILGEDIGYQFGRGYLDEESSIAHINRIGDKDFYIEYDGKFVDENGSSLIDDGGNEIKTIKQVIDYIKKLI